MTEDEACKIDQLLMAYATSEEANEVLHNKVDRLSEEVKNLSRVAEQCLAQTTETGRRYEYLERITRRMFEDKQLDTIPSPASGMYDSHEETTQPGE